MIEALKYLFAVIRWRFSPKKFLGRRVFVKGKHRRIIGESYRFFMVEGFPNKLFEKQQYRPTMVPESDLILLRTGINGTNKK